MLKALNLKNKIVFLTLAGIWLSIFSYYVYSSYLWDQDRSLLNEQEYYPEDYK